MVASTVDEGVLVHTLSNDESSKASTFSSRSGNSGKSSKSSRRLKSFFSRGKPVEVTAAPVVEASVEKAAEESRDVTVITEVEEQRDATPEEDLLPDSFQSSEHAYGAEMQGVTTAAGYVKSEERDGDDAEGPNPTDGGNLKVDVPEEAHLKPNRSSSSHDTVLPAACDAIPEETTKDDNPTDNGKSGDAEDVKPTDANENKDGSGDEQIAKDFFSQVEEQEEANEVATTAYKFGLSYRMYQKSIAVYEQQEEAYRMEHDRLYRVSKELEELRLVQAAQKLAKEEEEAKATAEEEAKATAEEEAKVKAEEEAKAKAEEEAKVKAEEEAKTTTEEEAKATAEEEAKAEDEKIVSSTVDDTTLSTREESSVNKEANTTGCKTKSILRRRERKGDIGRAELLKRVAHHPPKPKKKDTLSEMEKLRYLDQLNKMERQEKLEELKRQHHQMQMTSLHENGHGEQGTQDDLSMVDEQPSMGMFTAMAFEFTDLVKRASGRKAKVPPTIKFGEAGHEQDAAEIALQKFEHQKKPKIKKAPLFCGCTEL